MKEAAGRCLTDDLITEFAEGLLPPSLLGEVESHLAECATCRTLVAEVAGLMAPTEPPAPTSAERFGFRPVAAANYEIGREIARGGMGRILEAWDVRHQRRVAIKVLLRADAVTRQRFTREARITAQLQHPAIVPVYEAGAWSDGEPFFAMKFVVGRSLDEVVAASPSFGRRVALLPNIIAATEALAYAHGQGVVHRDLKPSNVLVGAFGETVVIDWGLAKELERGDTEEVGDLLPAEDPRLTTAGRAVGTPRYMAPEQARGEPVDARADVYALGALLYHVLAGVPPFEGRSSEELLAQLLAGPPGALSELVPEIAPDLDAIVSKAMARVPSDRYPSAHAMAADLERYAEGQLVSAHHYTLATLVRRWIARNRAIFAIAILSILALSVTGLLSLQRVVRERNIADQLRRVAEEKEHVAVARREAAENLTEYMVVELRARLDAVGRLDLLTGVGAEVERYYQSVADSGEALSPTSLARRAAALEVLSDGETAKHDYLAAGKRVSEAILLRERANREGSKDLELRAQLAESYLRLARVDTEMSKTDDSLAAARHAAGLAGELYIEAPENPRIELLIVSAERDLAVQLAAHGDPKGEVGARRDVRDVLRRMLAKDPGNVDTKRQLGETYLPLGKAEYRAGYTDDGLATETAALELFDDLVARDPRNAPLEAERADAMRLLAVTHSLVGDFGRAFDLASQCVATLDRLCERDPSNTNWQTTLAECLGGVVENGVPIGRTREARVAQVRAFVIDEATLAKHPEDQNAQRMVALNWLGFAQIALAEQNFGEAVERLGRALAIMDRLLATDPSRSIFRRTRAAMLQTLARAELGQRALDHAISVAEESESILTSLLAESPENDGLLGFRGAVRSDIGRVQLALSHTQSARRALEASLADFDLSARRSGVVAGEWIPDAIEASRNVSHLLVRAGEPSEARERLAVARDVLGKADSAKRLYGPNRELIRIVEADIAVLGRR